MVWQIKQNVDDVLNAEKLVNMKLGIETDLLSNDDGEFVGFLYTKRQHISDLYVSFAIFAATISYHSTNMVTKLKLQKMPSFFLAIT